MNARLTRNMLDGGKRGVTLIPYVQIAASGARCTVEKYTESVLTRRRPSDHPEDPLVSDY